MENLIAEKFFNFFGSFQTGITGKAGCVQLDLSICTDRYFNIFDIHAALPDDSGHLITQRSDCDDLTVINYLFGSIVIVFFVLVVHPGIVVIIFIIIDVFVFRIFPFVDVIDFIKIFVER